MPADFADFVAARGGVLWRSAWLLTGDAEAAERLLAEALTRTWRRSRDRTATDALEEQAERALLDAYLPRRSRDETETTARPVGELLPAVSHPGEDVVAAVRDDEAERTELLDGLSRLTSRQRAIVVLRHGERRSVGECSALLGWRTTDVDRVDAEASRRLRSTRLVGPRAAEPPRQPRPGSLDSDEEQWLRTRITAAVPDPPYAPTRAADAANRGRRASRRSLLVAGAAGLALVALLAPAVRGGLDDSGADDSAQASTARRLVDPLPIPDECADLPAEPTTPDLPLDLEQASVAWLRFCPAAGRSETISFVTDTTVVSGLDGLVESWVRSAGAVPCPHQRPVRDGATRIEFGTQDGQTHVVDLVVGECGPVRIDGTVVAVDGRTVFADAVRVLGRQLLGEIDLPVPGADRSRCPANPAMPQTADRTTVPDYPVTGVALPLPATGALVCRYVARPDGPADLVDTLRVGPPIAEQVRAAYLARPPVPSCVVDQDTGASTTRFDPLYAVVLSDGTGSWRTFGMAPGACGRVVGPGADDAVAGHWLDETVRFTVPLAGGPLVAGEPLF